MMIYLREARAQNVRHLGGLASIHRAAVASAVVNTIAGKDTPEFEEMVDRMMGADENHIIEVGDINEALPLNPGEAPPFASTPGTLEGFKEF